MLTTDTRLRYAALDSRISPEEYNFHHFRTKHLLRDAWRTLTTPGIMPGESAPDFDLPTQDGGRMRLSDLRGKPVLLTFSSYT